MAKTQAARRSAPSKSGTRKTRKSTTARKPTRSPKKWSAQVTETSDAMDLQQDVFKSDSPQRIAKSVKHSAEHSHRRKSSPFRSAMSMLTFYKNRAGKNLSPRRKGILDAAKNSLRRLFHRPAAN
ncbi:MAG TPA: DUF3175 domain-containing protein [Stellaceae bacterium]|nr:DUF3175 domain-containing protein [Stellaceae bacterium]